MKVTIKAETDRLKPGNPVSLWMSVHNHGTTEGRFCKYHTPFEGIMNDIFRVSKGSKKISYGGMMKKRIPPSEKDFVTLLPGETLDCKVSLEDYVMTKKGEYEIQFVENLISGLPSSNVIIVTVY